MDKTGKEKKCKNRMNDNQRLFLAAVYELHKFQTVKKLRDTVGLEVILNICTACGIVKADDDQHKCDLLEGKIR